LDENELKVVVEQSFVQLAEEYKRGTIFLELKENESTHLKQTS
jgi:hypothetical protein